MSKTMYHINCADCGNVFWSENPNIEGLEICAGCKRIKELEVAFAKIQRIAATSPPDMAILKICEEIEI